MRALAMVMVSMVAFAAVAVASGTPQASAAADLAGKVIVLDPGHGAAADGPLTRQVPTGRGGTKDCQTTGTATDAGFPEHTFTWDVALLVQDMLTQRGATTSMSRADDTGPAPCVDQRAAAANAAHPDAIVSIHGDGGPAVGPRLPRQLLRVRRSTTHSAARRSHWRTPCATLWCRRG